MKANKLEFEQLQNVSGGGSTNEENSNGFRKTCPRLKTQVPRTKVIKPKEVKCEVKIESFIKKDQTY